MNTNLHNPGEAIEAHPQAQPREEAGLLSAVQHIWSANEKSWNDVFHGKGTLPENLVVCAEVALGGLATATAVEIDALKNKHTDATRARPEQKKNQ